MEIKTKTIKVAYLELTMDEVEILKKIIGKVDAWSMTSEENSLARKLTLELTLEDN